MNERARGNVGESGCLSLVHHSGTAAPANGASLTLRVIPRRKRLKSVRCLIYAVGSTPASGFLWRWRTADGVEHSEQTFAYFYECMTHARARGLQVDLRGTITALQAHGVTPEPASLATDASDKVKTKIEKSEKAKRMGISFHDLS